MPNVGYVLKISDHAQLEEVLVLCPLWGSARSCGMKSRNNVGAYKDHGDSQFGSLGKC